ncbi:MAG: zinc carboxypeptidase, partial [Cyclobacteriaceae bacterium]
RGTENLKEWVKNGGIIIAWKSAGNWLNSCELTKLEFKKNPADTTGFKSYDDYAKNRGATVTGGSIFQANIDVTHPLGYGFTRSTLPLFRNHNLILKKASNPYANPLVYTASPLMSGYVHQSNLENLEKAPAAQIVASGRGLIIYLSDNPNFRAFWYGTNKLFFNAIYFGDVISSGTAR